MGTCDMKPIRRALEESRISVRNFLITAVTILGGRARTHSGRMVSLVRSLSALGFPALVIYIGLGIGCKKDTPITPPGPVTLQFDVYNHTKGYRSQFSKTVMSGDSLIIKVNELGVSDVDSQRTAIKEDNFGNHVIFSNTGKAAFTAPRQNMNYDVILFNSTNNAPYEWMDSQFSGLFNNICNYTVYRKDFDGQTGPEDVWANVFDQLNAALDLGFVKWGSINRQPNGTSGDFSYGYGDSHGASGWHAGSFITVNAKINPNNYVGTGLAEAFENICCVDDIGDHPTAGIIAPDGVLNPVGKDLFAYTFAKDDAK